MVRAYVVTFAFVTFRIMSDYSPLAHFYPAGERAITISWSSWVIPLMITEVILQLRWMKTSSAI